jgi:hypothetical protein
MKNKKHLNVALILILLFHFLTFADNPGDFGNQPADPTPTDAPINTQLWILVVVALGYAFVKTRNEYQKK